jgi:hypothetical protein
MSSPEVPDEATKKPSSGDSTAKIPDDGDRDDVLRAQQNAEEMEQSEDAKADSAVRLEGQDVPGLKILSSLMTATIFSDYFCYHANLLHLHRTPQERVEAHKNAHPKFYTTCRNLDLIARGLLFAVVTLTLVAVAGGFIWRTLYAGLQ